MKAILASILVAWMVASGVGDLLDGVVKSITAPIGNVIDFFFGEGEKKPPAETKPAERQQVIGTVRLTYDNFVLIYTPTGIAFPPGTTATTLDQDGKPTNCELRIGSERKNSFLVADVIKGSPKAGQLVVTRQQPAPGASDYQVLE